jgi:hypothetical protein
VDVGVTGEDGNILLELAPGPGLYRIGGLTEHDLRDIEFALAQRRAMSTRCPETDGEHTCGNSPGHLVSEKHGIRHQCRACTYRWPRSGRPEDPGQGDGT